MAQQGEVELSALGRATLFDNSRNTLTGIDAGTRFGGGARIGYFLTNRVSLEGDVTVTQGPRPMTSLLWVPATRLAYHQPISGAFGLVGGAGMSVMRFNTAPAIGPQNQFSPQVLAGIEHRPGRMTMRLEGTLAMTNMRISPFREARAWDPGVQLALGYRWGGRKAREMPPMISRPEPTPVPMRPEPQPQPPEPTLPAQPMPQAPMVIELGTINFAFDQSKVPSSARPLLDSIAAAAASRPDLMIEVVGHSDSVGALWYNLALSVRRAEAVRRELQRRGIAGSRVMTSGLGETSPAESNTTRDGRAANRRATVKGVPPRNP